MSRPRRTATPTKAAVDRPLKLNREAQSLYDRISREWDLTPAVEALLRLVATAITKAAQCEAVTAVEGMFIPDAKGASKPHPAALLARDYRAQAGASLQRLLNHMERN